VPDAIFADARLVLVYDAFDGPRDDLATYVAIAEELGADRVLDVGCGTGCLAIALAGTGRTVTGVDPAAASLDVARSKDGSVAVTWIHGDATARVHHRTHGQTVTLIDAFGGDTGPPLAETWML
jgi:2-polyprenyl-3-methyl-5-hydroxy-6-metoxy-1,4-benzoquinol methylase